MNINKKAEILISSYKISNLTRRILLRAKPSTFFIENNIAVKQSLSEIIIVILLLHAKFVEINK